MKITLTLNNKLKTIEVPPNRSLMDLLRSQGFWSVKRGCETANCGNCTVIMAGKAVYTCNMLAAQADGSTIETFEGAEESFDLEPLLQAFLNFTDRECNYCLGGFILSLKAVLLHNPEPTEEEIVDAVVGNHCRCAKEPLPIEAIIKAIRKMRRTL